MLKPASLSWRALPGLGVAFAALVPITAHAGNGLHPRTLVVWENEPCMTVVDRSVSPMLTLEYSIPFEDTDVTEDEVADSRRHQFLAFCRDKDPQTVLPNWVAWEDVVAAGEKPLDVDPDTTSDEDVLDLSTEWEGCWARITPDADRRPITDAMASMPVQWDTTGLAPGPWIVQGYTYEPKFNVYVRKPGIVQVVDDADPAATGPGIAITTGEQILYKGGETSVEGCVASMAGSTMTASWAVAEEDPSWTPFLEDEPVMGESFSIPFVAPEGLTGKTGMLRIEITDPMDRSYTTYMGELVMVLGQDDPNACEDGGGSFVSNPGCGGGDTGGADDTNGTGGGATDDGNPAGSSSSGPQGPGDTGGATADGGGAGESSSGGCRIGDDTHPPGWALGLLGLALLGIRRRD